MLQFIIILYAICYYYNNTNVLYTVRARGAQKVF